MGLYKRKKVWWYTVVYKSKRIQESTKTDNKKLAERIYAKVLIDIQEGRWFENQAKKKTIKEMIERYEKEYTENKSYYQKARDKTVFKHLYAFLGECCTLEEIENQIGGYEMFRRSKKAKPATILKELGLLRRIFNVARKQWKWKIPNPVSEIELPKVNNSRVRYLDHAERERLFSALDRSEAAWLKSFVTLAIETGLRLSNLCNLLWPEVNMFEKIIVINAEKMKNRDNLGIPLTDVAYDTLRELQTIQNISNYVFHDDGKKLYDRKVQRAFRNALKLARIENFRFHDLRHTFASRCVQVGVDLYAVQKLLGHKDGRMTQRYAHLSSEYLRDAINKLNKSATNLLHSEIKESVVSL
jgi:integrase